MEPLFAEIADKMSTVGEMWLWMVPITGALVPFALIHRRAAVVVAIVGCLLSAFFVYGNYHQAHLEGDFSAAVWDEMGAAWVAHSILASLLPAVATVAIAIGWALRHEPREPGTTRPDAGFANSSCPS